MGVDSEDPRAWSSDQPRKVNERCAEARGHLRDSYPLVAEAEDTQSGPVDRIPF